MHIVRFQDAQGNSSIGRRHGDGTVTLLAGDLSHGFSDTGKRTGIARLLSPLQPAAILCIGLNYRKHAEETGAPIPDQPVLFMKNPAALNHPGDPIVLHPSCLNPPQVDYEVELAVVIGKAARDVPADEALHYVFGYTVANDVSARRWQKEGGAGQWVRGKSFDTFCPLGPALVTADEIGDPQDLELRTVLNGQTMQQGHTGDMIFPVAALIERLSRGMTLVPGSVILTGTPPGVGVARRPQVFLKPGDRLDLTIEGIGTLTSPVV